MKTKRINRPAIFTTVFVIVSLILLTIIVTLVVNYHKDLAKTKQQLISPSILSTDSDAEIWRKNSSYYIVADGKTYYITDESSKDQIDDLINRLQMRSDFGLLFVFLLFLSFAVYRYYYGAVLEIQDHADEKQAQLERMINYQIELEKARKQEELDKAEFRKTAKLYDWASEEPTEVLAESV